MKEKITGPKDELFAAPRTARDFTFGGPHSPGSSMTWSTARFPAMQSSEHDDRAELRLRHPRQHRLDRRLLHGHHPAQAGSPPRAGYPPDEARQRGGHAGPGQKVSRLPDAPSGLSWPIAKNRCCWNRPLWCYRQHMTQRPFPAVFVVPVAFSILMAATPMNCWMRWACSVAWQAKRCALWRSVTCWLDSAIPTGPQGGWQERIGDSWRYDCIERRHIIDDNQSFH